VCFCCHSSAHPSGAFWCAGMLIARPHYSLLCGHAVCPGAAVGSLGAPAFLAAPAGAVPRPAGGLGPIMPPAAAAM